MIDYILLMVSVFLGVLKNITSKAGKESFSGLSNLFKVNIITSIIAMVIFGFSGFDINYILSPLIILLALLYGVFTMLSQMLFIEAVKDSSVAVCSLIYSCGFIIPTIFSVIFYKENVSVFQIAALMMLIVSFMLVTEVFAASDKHKNNFTLAFFAMISSGIVGVLQKIISVGSIITDFSSFLFLAFGTILVISAVGALSAKKGNTKSNHSKKFFVLAVILGISFAFANKINLRLSGIIPGVIFFPVINGGCIALSAVFALILFSEKLSKSKIFGIFLGIASIIIIAVF